MFFFFQAEDGIRDSSVTGVQTCALPIFELDLFETDAYGGIDTGEHAGQIVAAGDLFEALAIQRIEVDVEAAKPGIVKRLGSEEGRGGGEGRYRWAPDP